MAIWKNTSRLKNKPWGHEDRFQPRGQTGVKMIHLKEGHRTSLKKLKSKNQIYICVAGLVKVDAPNETEFTDDGTFTLRPGDQLTIEKNNPYRLEGLKDSILIEITDHSSYEALQGIEMIEDDYGRKGIHPSLVNFRIH
jgi:mannose-6-phosphate isomerase-like protein (cupin superfamily)